jgi:YrbI family 3-deoxy-D-manno-octulosonate 8-phosphate phosphatase
MAALAIIPARGGSKGIPRKNLAPLCGKPLIAWCIEAALASESIERVVVSTDDEEIALVAERFGATAVRRPVEISGDLSSSEAALLHCLEHLEATENYSPELVAFLQCTSPLMTADDIDGTVNTLRQSDADSALTVTDFHYYLWRQSATGESVGVNHDARERLMRQQRESEYLETGSVYVMKTVGFLEAKHRFFGKTVCYQTPAERCWEIDEPIDMEIAEVLMRRRLREEKALAIPGSLRTLVLDFDGVFTDNRVLTLQDGSEAVSCDRSDGLAISLLQQAGVEVLVLSSEKNSVVAARCRKLKIECIHGIEDKWPRLEKWLTGHGVDPRDVAYVGNDVNDLVCLQKVGCGIVPIDAYEDVRRVAHVILSAKGGRGAIREVAELITKSLGENQRAEAA